MKTIKINNYRDVEQLKSLEDKELRVNLETCEASQRTRVIDFLAGMTFKKGSLKKVKAYEYIVQFF